MNNFLELLEESQDRNKSNGPFPHVPREVPSQYKEVDQPMRVVKGHSRSSPKASRDGTLAEEPEGWDWWHSRKGEGEEKS